MNDRLLLHRFMLRLLRRIAGDTVVARMIAQHAPATTALFDRSWYEASYPDVRGCDPLVHYIAFGAAEGRNPHPLFDARYYVEQHPEARDNPLMHYANKGASKRYVTHPVHGFCLIPPLGRPLRVLTLLVRYGTSKYPGADDRLESLMSRILPHAQRRTIIIDNALPPAASHLDTCGRTVIAGDNSRWEFSGWDCGLQFAARELDDFDFIHFATDAFEQFGADFPERVNVPMLEALRFGRAVAGHIDYYNEPALLFRHTVQSWIRSSFFFLSPQVIRALGSMVSIHDSSALFTGDPARPFRTGSAISEKLAGYLTAWLTGPGLGQEVEWHSRFELSEQTLSFFEAKSVAILNELMLSERLRSLGCWMADVTWMRGVIDRVVRGRLFDEQWRDQVANRPL